MIMGARCTRLLAALLLLGLCALGEAQKPDPCQCSRVSTKNRLNCGFPGISSDQCFSASCCFDSSIPGVPWCFKPLPKQESEECVMEVSARKNCGYPGISPEECASRKCCFSDTIPQVPWCFFPLSVQGGPWGVSSLPLEQQLVTSDPPPSDNRPFFLPPPSPPLLGLRPPGAPVAPLGSAGT
ncbi:PREDICTED: trefoil factor 2 [Lipotes vexillifer]|uniref:Trefoil factor 2 n=1 Tax=Lipotes vexillifer TaxID=118797 RepID=A0A340WVA6_LIPVE|nr:PREDICTED: trefoil factor 2 [Lipotes vexillifer]